MIDNLGSVNRATAPMAPVPSPPSSDAAPTGDVEFSFNCQDQMVMSPGTTVVHGVGKGPSVDKAELLSKKPKPKDGKYVYQQSDPQFHSAVSLATVAKTIEMLEGAMGEKINWPFDRAKLGIHPDAGQDFNAYYSRDEASLNFFHDTDPVTKQKVFSADSGEVVAHETGHAVLDAMRPGYFSTWSPDPGGFHEGFGDVVAMLMGLLDDGTRAKAIEQTGGDLSKTSVISELGEELGTAINHSVGENVTGGNYTRNAINNFKWADPDTLPENGGPDELGREVHSYGRLWVGATYDLIKGMVDRNLQAGMNPDEALKGAGEETLQLYGSLMKTAPKGDHTYRDMAVALIRADQQYCGGKDTDLITQVYKDRRILPEDFDPKDIRRGDIYASVDEPRTIRVKLDGPQFGKFSGATVESASDAPLAMDTEEKRRVQTNVERLISQGRILYTEPHQKVTTKDLFDANGRPYAGVVRWQDGHMSIERVKIAT